MLHAAHHFHPVHNTCQHQLVNESCFTQQCLIARAFSIFVTICLGFARKSYGITCASLQFSLLGHKWRGWRDFDFSSSVTANVSERIARQVSSIGQDIVYCTSKGSVKPPKHLALPMEVRNLTGSALVIELLNRFGHGVAHSQVVELDTALEVANVSEEQSCDSFIPQNIYLSHPDILCYDNNDLQEETLTGSGTTHCTNGIIVQRSLPDSEVLMYRQSKSAEQSMHSCKRQRSFM